MGPRAAARSAREPDGQRAREGLSWRRGEGQGDAGRGRARPACLFEKPFDLFCALNLQGAVVVSTQRVIESIVNPHAQRHAFSLSPLEPALVV